MNTWSWILSTAFFVMGLWVNELSGRKVWWVWIPVIIEQVVWAIYSALTSQWGFVMFSSVYVVMYARNLKRWHNDHLVEAKMLDNAILNGRKIQQ